MKFSGFTMVLVTDDVDVGEGDGDLVIEEDFSNTPPGNLRFTSLFCHGELTAGTQRVRLVGLMNF